MFMIVWKAPQLIALQEISVRYVMNNCFHPMESLFIPIECSKAPASAYAQIWQWHLGEMGLWFSKVFLIVTRFMVMQMNQGGGTGVQLCLLPNLFAVFCLLLNFFALFCLLLNFFKNLFACCLIFLPFFACCLIFLPSFACCLLFFRPRLPLACSVPPPWLSGA